MGDLDLKIHPENAKLANYLLKMIVLFAMFALGELVFKDLGEEVY